MSITLINKILKIKINREVSDEDAEVMIKQVNTAVLNSLHHLRVKLHEIDRTLQATR